MKTMYKAVSTVVAGVWLLGAQAQAEPLHPLLEELIQNHPQIHAAREGVESSKASKKEAFSGFLPQANLTGSTGWQQYDTSDTNPPGKENNYPTDSYGLNITQSIFNGFRTKSATDAATININIAENTLEQTRQQILFEASTAYMEVLRQLELTRLAMENQETLKKQLHLEDERVQRGSGIAVDVLQAKSRLQIAKERHTAFMGALKDAVSRYTQVFGKMPEMDTMDLPAVPTGALPASLDEAIAIATAENPSLKNSDQAINVTAKAKETAKAGFYPTLDLVADAKYDDNLNGTSGGIDNYTLVFRSNWNLFSGFGDQARVARAAAEHQASINNNAHARRKVTEETKLAWSALTTSRERLELLDNAVNIAGEVFDARRRLRDAGKETALNVLDAENELYRAKIDAAFARFDYYNSVYRVLLSMGRLKLESL